MRRVLLLILLASCGEYRPTVVFEGNALWADCGMPQYAKLSGPQLTYGVLHRDSAGFLLKECTWWWYGGLAVGGNELTRVATVRTDSVDVTTPGGQFLEALGPAPKDGTTTTPRTHD